VAVGLDVDVDVHVAVAAHGNVAANVVMEVDGQAWSVARQGIAAMATSL